MKKILLFFSMVFAAAAAFAQTPQSVCYQAVATDQSGHELISQNIKVRVSILKGSASGSTEWSEEQSVTTDGFGLFNLNIGQGARAAGAQNAFSGIKWGADAYYLKIEMDPNGGTNYLLMGVSQLLSVPYALYSDKANSANYSDSSRISNTANTAVKANFADSSRISNTSIKATYADSSRASYYSNTSVKATYADSSRISNTSNIAVKATYADSSRISNTSIIAVKATYADSSRSSYTTNIALKSYYSDSSKTAINAINAVNAQYTINAQYASRSPKSDTALFAWLADSARRAAFASRAGIADSANRAALAWNAVNASNAVNAQSAVNALSAFNAQNSVNAQNSSRAAKADTATFATFTNQAYNLDYTNGKLTLTNPNPGGKSTSVNLYSNAFTNPGASIEFPLGILGSALLISKNYTVPAGKSLFISAVNTNVVLGTGQVLFAEPGMPIIPENVTVTSCYCSAILIDNQPAITPVIIDLTLPSASYTVPAGKTLVIKSGKTSGGRLDLQVDSDTYSFYTTGIQAPRLVVITPGKSISKPVTILAGESLVLTGYLLQN